MNDFRQRSTQTELIDRPDIDFADWAVCLRELNTINTWLGGHAITVSGIRKLTEDVSGPVKIAEIGCGGGDNLLAIERWNRGKHDFSYMGIDLNAACIAFANQRCANLPGAQFICSDYRDVDFVNSKPDIIFTSLFCHHFSNAALIEMLGWLRENARLGFFINDLHRHPMAFQSISWLTKLFSRSYLVRHDAPVSVMRGFTRREWETLLEAASLKRYRIQWRWAFRHLVTFRNDEADA